MANLWPVSRDSSRNRKWWLDSPGPVVNNKSMYSMAIPTSLTDGSSLCNHKNLHHGDLRTIMNLDYESDPRHHCASAIGTAECAAILPPSIWKWLMTNRRPTSYPLFYCIKTRKRLIPFLFRSKRVLEIHSRTSLCFICVRKPLAVGNCTVAVNTFQVECQWCNDETQHENP